MTSWLKATLLAVAAVIIVAATGLPARAQTLPSEPIVFGDGRLTLGGDAAVSFAPQDPGFFNYTDYEHSALRMLRLDLTAALKADDHLSFLADMRSENVDSPSFGIEKRLGGHMFQLNFSNAFGIQMSQIAQGAASNKDWYMGFNLTRKFY